MLSSEVCATAYVGVACVRWVKRGAMADNGGSARLHELDSVLHHERRQLVHCLQLGRRE